MTAVCRLTRAGCAALVALAVAQAVVAGQHGADGGEWRSYAGDAGSTKYSPLAQITPENVGDLAVAWRWVSVDGQLDLEALRERYPALRVANDTGNVSINGLKGTPLMVGDTLYLSTPLSQVAAIDAATGKKLWQQARRLTLGNHYGGNPIVGTPVGTSSVATKSGAIPRHSCPDGRGLRRCKQLCPIATDIFAVRDKEGSLSCDICILYSCA